MFPSAKSEQLVAMGRDRVMEFMREHGPAMDEAGQRDFAAAATSFMQDIVRSAVAVVAAKDFPFIPATLKDANLEGKGKFTFVANQSTISQLAGRHGQQVLLVLADPRVFDEHRPDAQIEPDEPGLPLDERGDEEPASVSEVLNLPLTFAEPPVTVDAAGRIVLAYNAGYDAAGAELPYNSAPGWVTSSAPLEKEFQRGWADQQQDRDRARPMPEDAEQEAVDA